MNSWNLVKEPVLLQFCSSLPVEYFLKQRWFADRQAPGPLSLVDFIQFKHAESSETLISINLYSIEPGAAYLYYLPLLITRTDVIDSGLKALFSDGGYNFYDAVPTAEYLSLLGHLTEAQVYLSGQSGVFEFLANCRFGSEAFQTYGSSSNSLLFVGERLLIKNYRRIYPGINPELRLYSALANLPSTPVPGIHGFFHYFSSQEYTLGIIEEFVQAKNTGWGHWGDLIKTPNLPEKEATLRQEAFELGTSLASLHRYLLKSAQGEGLLQPFNGSELEARFQSLYQHGCLPMVNQEAVLTGLTNALSWLAPYKLGFKHNIHGDLHLEQILKTDSGWKIIDFEGEPLKPIAERENYDSPLKDLASLLRSVSYRVHTLELTPVESAKYETLLRDEIIQGYKAQNDSWETDFTASGSFDQLVLIFEIERVIYEYNYEANYRPDWLHIPLMGLAGLLARLTKGDSSK